MSNETPAEVLADMRRRLPHSGLHQWADRLERSLAAGKVAGEMDRTAPPKVWLQIDTNGDAEDRSEAIPRTAWDDLTWCYESIGGQEIEYIRADLAYTAPPADPALHGPEFMAWCGHWFGPDSDETHIANAVRELLKLPADPAKASAPEYDRSLIADMLESANGLRDEMYSHDSIIEQIRLLRAADNADAAKVRTVRASGSAPDVLSEDDVQWIVNDLAELGVMIRGQAFFLYKGDSLVYEDAKHEDGRPMHYRTVGKREFGECCHPINHKDYSLKGTVSLDDSDRWQLLPPALATPPASASDGCGACGNGCNGGPCRVLQDSPPASAPEVRRLIAAGASLSAVLPSVQGESNYFAREELREFRAALTAALQQEGKSHG